MPIYKEENNTWTVRFNYTDSNGKARNKKIRGFKTKSEAAKALSKLNIEHQTPSTGITFDQIFEEYKAEQRSKVKPTTHMHYQALYDHMKENIGSVVIEKLTIPRYKEFKKYLDDRIIKVIKDENGNDVEVHMSTSRKNRCHKFVKTLIRLAYDNYGIVNNVPDRVGGFVNPIEIEDEDSEDIVFLTENEFQTYLKQFEGNVVYYTLFMVLFYEGLRIGEALALNWNDIDFGKGIIHISKTYTGKINKEYQTGSLYIVKPKTKKSIRHLPVERKTLECLKELHTYYSGFDGFEENWFVFGGIHPLSETTIAKKKDDAISAAKVTRITLHQFRHSCASYLFEKGVKPTAVQQYLGHSKLSTTMNIYTHLYPEDLMNIHN